MKSASVMLLSSAGTFVSIVFIPAFAKEEVGADPLQIGFIVGLFNLTYLLSSFAFGRWADMHGRRMVLLFGLLASAGATVTQIFAMDPLTLALSRSLVGFATGAYPAALLTYAHDTREKMGRYASYGALGWGFGSLFAGFIGIYWQIFAFSAILFFLGFLVALILPFGAEPLVDVPRFPINVLKNNAPVYIAVFIRHAGANAVWVLFAPYMIEILNFDFAQVGMIFAINPFFQFLVMRTSDRFNSLVLVSTGLLFSIIAFSVMGFATTFPAMAATHLLIGVSWGTLYVGSLKFIMERNIERTTATGLLGSTISVSSIIGPLIGGGLVTGSLYFGLALDAAYRTTFYAAAVMSAVALVILLRIFRMGSTRYPAS